MKKQVIPTLVFALALAAAATILLVSPLGRQLEEDLGLAVLFKLRGPRTPPAGIVIINIDAQSAEILGVPAEPHKWPRNIYAELMERLIDYRPALIVFDIHFADHKDPQHDRLLARAFRRAGNVILVERLVRRKVEIADNESLVQPAELEILEPPISLLAEASLAMAPFPLPKIPVRINQAWTFKTSIGDIPTLPVVTLQALALIRNLNSLGCFEQIVPAGFAGLSAPVQKMVETAGLVETMRQVREQFPPNTVSREIPSPPPAPCAAMTAADWQLMRSLAAVYGGNNNVYVNFYGPPATLPTYPIHMVINDRDTKTQALKDMIRDKVVFIGAAQTFWSEQKDGFFTVFSNPDGLDLSGVEIAATVFANLRDDLHLKMLPFGFIMPFMLTAAVVVCLISFLLPPMSAALALFAFAGGGLLVCRLLFGAGGIWPPVIVPLAVLPVGSYLSAILFKYFRARRERKHMDQALRLYLPDRVVEEIAQDLSFITSGDRMIYGACLLSDAENYTTLSERLDPRELSRVMKDYFGLLIGQVQEQGGTVTNMIGDSMFALWPSTEPIADLKSKACQAALGIQDVLNQFNEAHPEHALPTRIGLHSGYLLMGHIGSAGHYEYAPVGDIVNTASRIEGLNKKLSTRLLASEETVDEEDGFKTRLMGTFLLSGKSNPITIYQILPDDAWSDAVAPVYTELFPTALELFRAQQWQQAETALARCLDLEPNDGPSRFYLDLCKSYRRKPPSSEWQGIIPVEK